MPETQHPVELYRCPKCAHVATDLETDDTSVTCPGCGTDEPPFAFTRVYPPLNDEETTRLESIGS